MRAYPGDPYTNDHVMWGNAALSRPAGMEKAYRAHIAWSFGEGQDAS